MLLKQILFEYLNDNDVVNKIIEEMILMENYERKMKINNYIKNNLIYYISKSGYDNNISKYSIISYRNNKKNNYYWKQNIYKLNYENNKLNYINKILGGNIILEDINLFEKS